MQRVSAAGLIPAHAGKTPGRLDIHVSAWAHPRSRGENRVIKPGGYLLAGSSPLTRGKRFAAGGQGTSPGLIPAHAGKTPRRRRGGWYSGAHPRSRGENSAALGYETPSRGSSPLTRGKHHRRRQRAQTCGLIPAHAGKTHRTRRGAERERAHPRSRGENARSPIHDYTKEGSSPLTRGKLWDGIKTSINNGLIPAHAGKTGCRRSEREQPRAHPRSRGENPVLSLTGISILGSSPLTRGKLQVGDAGGAGGGLIPAHAGKTCRCRSWPRRPRAHPRSRGENWTGTWDGISGFGSSPLTRGKPHRPTASR